jgi:hypothetical protein
MMACRASAVRGLEKCGVRMLGSTEPFDLGSWILDLGSWVLASCVLASCVLDSWVLDLTIARGPSWLRRAPVPEILSGSEAFDSRAV